MKIVEYDDADPVGILHLNLLSLGWPLTPELAARIRRLDPRPLPCFAVYAIEDGVVAGQVGVYRLPMVSVNGPEDVGGVCAVCTHPAFSGRGIATCLLEEAHARMRAGRLTLFLVGAFLIGFAIFIGKENTQVEGAIFGLLTGVVQMSVIHYLIAKIIGPVLFGRMWCGWACWTVMVLDLLPFKRPTPPPELCSTVVSCEHLDMSARVFLRCQVFPNNTWCLRDVFERAGKHSPRT